MTPAPWRAVAMILYLAAVLGCGGSNPEAPVVQLPEPDMTDMEPQVRRRLEETRAAILAAPESAAAWGRFGMVAHAHELWREAEVAYLQAQRLDPDNVRWAYFLGDVLSIVGTDLEAAEELFRSVLERRPEYGPAHMRLGNVLLAMDRGEEASGALERALELESALDPARVALAQLRLAQGDLEGSEQLLDEVLARAPKHGQALATLGQVYMRQGRREEARVIAERARDPASYNLFSDPLMSEVVAEGLSSVLLWERAKSFLEDGNYRQAVLGLRQVAGLLPSNAEVQLQLAVAYGGLGEIAPAGRHLERAVELDPELADARLRLGAYHLEQRNPVAAISHLRRAMDLRPDDPETGWLLARALVQSGDPVAAVDAFAKAREAAEEVPTWAHNDWGSALAQTGRTEEALEHFRAALAANPDDPQALFFSGLALEGLGLVEAAVDQYCRSLRVQGGSPAAGRLEALGRACR